MVSVVLFTGIMKNKFYVQDRLNVNIYFTPVVLLYYVFLFHCFIFEIWIWDRPDSSKPLVKVGCTLRTILYILENMFNLLGSVIMCTSAHCTVFCSSLGVWFPHRDIDGYNLHPSISTNNLVSKMTRISARESTCGPGFRFPRVNSAIARSPSSQPSSQA